MAGRRWMAVGVIVSLLGAGCGGSDQESAPSTDQNPVADALLTVLNETGGRIDGATFTPVGAEPVVLSPTGAVPVRGPTAGVVNLDGYLPEPVVLDPSQPAREVVLFARSAPDGTPRVALHFGGDTMMGRRYQQPTRDDTPVVSDAAEARGVVAAVAPLLAAADASTVNLETVVGELPIDEAYAGKRYLLQSPPAITAALNEMGIDLVTLGNNHLNDWHDRGVASTLDELKSARIAFAGAGRSAEDAERGTIITAGPLRVGVVSMTSVNGDFVNDSLPGADVPPPPDLAADDAWQYADRRFGFGSLGEPGYIETASRRPAEWWQLFEAIEPTLDAKRAAELWAALTAPGAVPELQDWVARRGHGGAAAFSTAGVAAQVAALRNAGVDLVVVQLHGGFMLSEAPSEFFRAASRSAVDAGADLVINHHPHVLQGFEWYKDKLIAYSLGNLVFDQDFASTFPSMFVRAVFEGNKLLQARLVPVLLDAYRPMPLSGEGEQRVLQLVDERSAIAAVSDRSTSGRIITRVDTSLTPNAAVDIRTGVVVPGRPSELLDVTLDSHGFGSVDRCAVLRPTLPDLQYGTDLLTGGGMADVTANGAADYAPWFKSDGSVVPVVEDGNAFLRLDGHPGDAFVRPVARAAMAEHRRFDAGDQPLDAAAQYTLQFDAHLVGDSPISVRTAWYSVDDTDPNVEPESTLLAEETTELPGPGGEWQTLTLDLTDSVAALGVKPDAALVEITLPRVAGTLDVDNVSLYEWRSFVPGLSNQWQAVDAVRGAPGAKVQLEASGCAPR